VTEGVNGPAFKVSKTLYFKYTAFSNMEIDAGMIGD
jgi:hypothetical protein